MLKKTYNNKKKKKLVKLNYENIIQIKLFNNIKTIFLLNELLIISIQMKHIFKK